MEKGYENVNDTKTDVKSGCDIANADFGGELAKDDGVDLNAGQNKFDSNWEDSNKIMAKEMDEELNAIRQIKDLHAAEMEQRNTPGEYRDAPTPRGFTLPEGYTSNIDELMGDLNGTDSEAEAKRAEQWQHYAETADRYEAEQTADKSIDAEALENAEQEETDNLMGTHSSINADEMQEELDLNGEKSDYVYGNEGERQSAEAFMNERPELFQGNVRLTDTHPVGETYPEYFQNPDSDTAVFGPYNDGKAENGSYVGVGREEGYFHFNHPDPDTYNSHAREARINNEDPYERTGNSDAVQNALEDGKEPVFTENPGEIVGRTDREREFQQIQEATGITQDDVYEDEKGHYHLDTDGVWIAPEDRNAEYNDAYDDDENTGTYVSDDDNTKVEADDDDTEVGETDGDDAEVGETDDTFANDTPVDDTPIDTSPMDDMGDSDVGGDVGGDVG